jgi:hypothetical protein
MWGDLLRPLPVAAFVTLEFNDRICSMWAKSRSAKLLFGVAHAANAPATAKTDAQRFLGEYAPYISFTLKLSTTLHSAQACASIRVWSPHRKAVLHLIRCTHPSCQWSNGAAISGLRVR